MRLAPRVQRTARAGRFEAGAHQAADAATRSAAAPPVSLNSALWPSSALVHWSSVVKKSFEELPFSCRIRCSKTRTGSHEDPFTGVLTQAGLTPWTDATLRGAATRLCGKTLLFYRSEPPRLAASRTPRAGPGHQTRIFYAALFCTQELQR